MPREPRPRQRLPYDWADQSTFLHPERRRKSPRRNVDELQFAFGGGAVGGVAGLIKDLHDGTVVSNGQEFAFLNVQSMEWIGLGVTVGAIVGYGFARYLNSRR